VELKIILLIGLKRNLEKTVDICKNMHFSGTFLNHPLFKVYMLKKAGDLNEFPK
jgi:hypothetical protein